MPLKINVRAVCAFSAHCLVQNEFGSLNQLETEDGGLAGPDNPGLEPLKTPATTEPTFGDGITACTRPVGMAATRDNGHVDDKLLDVMMMNALQRYY